MNTNRSLPRRAALAATAAAAGLALAACGSSDSTNTAGTTAATTTAPASTEADRHNQADVTFAQGMIPHHRQAIVMSDMVESHGASNEVKELAEKIEKAQKPEIDTMTGWLKAWGEKVPTGFDMGHGDDNSGMPGMMGDQDINRLGKAKGNAFDTMFLTMMIEHHEGAIDMAETEKEQGAYGPAKALADSIITSQTAEIAQMRTMLAG
ncbi:MULTISPECIES: DUF305 domain-containing protein [unclassified Streptomyces]|uniref:DUF305 domain-containing protein n=1 Tax=unclassified Streptomyces TaxID=2593676 RepID=UPI00202FB842|nr:MULTISPECIES: DUF305 domain-containing protein [unclassified Streptomyces]MCM1966055.1 DUF305 domain-containing protein [Streptomyces sp. G1]MCX5126902.1 DUF305 domain-containing protein [Streptomyces sp. NBC_00347]